MSKAAGISGCREGGAVMAVMAALVYIIINVAHATGVVWETVVAA